MIELPSLAVITPTFNRGNLLRRLFNSIKQHNTIKQWIIVDDGSSDRTYEQVLLFQEESREDLKITYIYRDNKGMKGALNAGIPFLETKYFCKVDSDDYLSDNFEELYIELFVYLARAKEVENYNILSMACEEESGKPINWISKKLKRHHKLKNGYVLEYAKDRLYCKNLSGDLLDMFLVEPAKNLFRYPYLEGYGHCPTGILHMFYILFYRERKQLFINRIGLVKEYMDDGITKMGKNTLSESPYYYVISALMELALPNHSLFSKLKSLKTFSRASWGVIINVIGDSIMINSR